MALHHCKWASDRVSLLVDAEDEGAAREIAADLAEGEEPGSVVVLAPRVFVAEIVIEDGDEDEGEDAAFLEVLPLDHTIDVLATLEDDAPHGDVVPADDATCGESADADEGEIVFCELGARHDGDHEATTSEGGLVHWPRATA